MSTRLPRFAQRSGYRDTATSAAAGGRLASGAIIGIGIGIGANFGFYPRKAARLDPIEARRYE